jgi:hypothetical protein
MMIRPKLLILPLLLLFIPALASSQDIIVLQSGEEIKAKVVAIDLTEIKYIKFENLTGPKYILDKGLVFMIRYENGTKDVFGSKPAIQNTGSGKDDGQKGQDQDDARKRQDEEDARKRQQQEDRDHYRYNPWVPWYVPR